MKVIRDIHSLKTLLEPLFLAKKSLGLVPTMGALHRGHMSLLDAANKENDFSIVTIFVNPLQFNSSKDLRNYPVSAEEDMAVLEKQRCDIVFIPEAKEIYPEEPVLKLSFGYMDTILEGAYRPGHFSGVGLVVMKLFNLISPTRAYFGQKDLQQFKVIELLVIDSSLPVLLRMMPTIREESGLAFSSRNVLLNSTQRQDASHIHMALVLACDQIDREGSVKSAKKIALSHLHEVTDITVEYLSIVSLKNLKEVESASDADQLALCFAGYFGGVRLIDNVILNQSR